MLLFFFFLVGLFSFCIMILAFLSGTHSSFAAKQQNGKKNQHFLLFGVSLKKIQLGKIQFI